ncbi:MAG TPA: hypothetical protein PLE07_02160 [Candidatus Paceibacterota bacterium]|nr:hypothetical protein [Candidatus Paceibacterota bacterium]
MDFILNLIGNFLGQAWYWISLALPFTVFFLPFVLAYALWESYLAFIRERYINKEERILLEVKIPKEISKSPAAMELLMHVFYQTYEGELVDQYIKGTVRSWFSLELASFGGEIHFYFNIPKFFKDLVEAQIYSQYPEVEIFEVDDYTQQVNFGQPDSSWEIFGWEWKFAKADIYPIKTYYDFGLEKDPKEEYKVDPMTPLMEFLGSIRQDEQVWFQFLVMGGKDRFPIKNKKAKWYNFFSKVEMKGWKDASQEELQKILKREEKGEDIASFVKLTMSPGERLLAEAVERHLAKLCFDVGIRAIYASKEGIRPIVKVGVGNSIKQFGSPGMNGFKVAATTSYNQPWEDYKGIRARRLKKLMFKYFRERAYFYPPASKKPMVMTTEELATLYHFPGQAVTTPSLSRIPSKRGEPPVNLPL